MQLDILTKSGKDWKKCSLLSENADWYQTLVNLGFFRIEFYSKYLKDVNVHVDVLSAKGNSRAQLFEGRLALNPDVKFNPGFFFLCSTHFLR